MARLQTGRGASVRQPSSSPQYGKVADWEGISLEAASCYSSSPPDDNRAAKIKKNIYIYIFFGGGLWGGIIFLLIQL